VGVKEGVAVGMGTLVGVGLRVGLGAEVGVDSTVVGWSAASGLGVESSGRAGKVGRLGKEGCQLQADETSSRAITNIQILFIPAILPEEFLLQLQPQMYTDKHRYLLQVISKMVIWGCVRRQRRRTHPQTPCF